MDYILCNRGNTVWRRSMCPLCPCSGTTAQYGGGGACVPYVPVVVLQHSMKEEEHVSPMSL